ncbi:dual specificity protein phosphatase family protein [Nostoc sp. FACHB-280]|uniref:protein-tyrosine phosphatase family protein n=1 Tax=Nostoc sp. FACHB-280 TaxID=2692839 RepID=UPI00168B1378|nr:dual specificity protein phosphatase family protein [Nostoc sp. FACHB-280]MBD2495398.1 dual specificity protein phosphatase family protein [Nostoc sp. FACHB-280]
MYRFAAAGEQELIVFGACRPGYSNKQVSHWINFMKAQNIQRVCCLLPEKQLALYSNLLDRYQQEFGSEQVCSAPIIDFQFAEVEMMTQTILPFLIAADKQNQKVVVHCSGGIGRTGHVLAAWLVSIRGFSNKDAIAAVKRTGRNPHEAVIASVFIGKNPFRVVKQLDELLNNCRIAMCSY